MALKRKLEQAYLNLVFLAKMYFVEPIILSITFYWCAWERQLFYFNFIIKHSHLAQGQCGANLLLRSFVPGRSFSWVVTVRITLHIKCQLLELCDQQPEHNAASLLRKLLQFLSESGRTENYLWLYIKKCQRCFVQTRNNNI